MLSASPTKPEIIAITIAKLKLNPGDTFCIREEAITVAEQNFAAAGILDKTTLLHREASEAIADLPARIDCAFVGGTKNVESVLAGLCAKVRGRVVANAARIETAARIIGCMKSLGIFEEVIHVQVSKGYELAGETAFKPMNPVYIMVGDTDR